MAACARQPGRVMSFRASFWTCLLLGGLALAGAALHAGESVARPDLETRLSPSLVMRTRFAKDGGGAHIRCVEFTDEKLPKTLSY